MGQCEGNDFGAGSFELAQGSFDGVRAHFRMNWCDCLSLAGKWDLTPCVLRGHAYI